MQALHSIEDLEALISRYEDEGGQVYRLGDESLGLGTVILTAPEELHLYSFIIKEVYLNEWSSGHTLRRYHKLPKKYKELVEGNVYFQEYGCSTREQYLQLVADDFGAPIEEVYALAEVLGPSEDFDGLISALEDKYEGGIYE